MAAKKRSSVAAKKAKPSARKAAAERGGAATKKVVAAVAQKKVAKARPVPSATAAAGKRVAPAKPAKKAAGAPAKRPAAAAAPAGTGLAEGERAPSFSLLNQAGQTLSSSELDGKPYVIYFYPKDDTPGCTTEACGFRDTGVEFEDLGVRVIGVSPDSVASHLRFAGKYGLPFTLLSDPEQALASRYGVWALKKNYGREYMGIVRSTFLVDADGVIRKVWRGVRVNGHVAEVHAAAAALG